MRDGFIAFGAENQRDGRIFLGATPVLNRVIQVKVHLPRVGMREPPEFEVFCGARRYVASACRKRRGGCILLNGAT